jgi:uncharacterized protein (DUF58 family)
VSAVLGAEFVKRLERLAIRVRRAFAGRMQGERRSTKRGVSVEFADYREYVSGDDPRYLDWNAAARMDRLYLKLYVEEEDLSVYFLVDASAWMEFGKPPKIDFARAVAAALAYVSLSNLDRVSVATFTEERGPILGPKRGRKEFFALLDFLNAAAPSGATSLASSVKQFIAGGARRGPVFVVSDFLDPAGWEQPLGLLRHTGYQPMAVHVMASEELEAPDGEDVRLVDSETGAAVDLSLTSAIVKSYRARVEAFRRGIEGFCRSRDIPYAFARSDQDLEDFVLRSLRVLMLEA